MALPVCASCDCSKRRRSRSTSGGKSSLSKQSLALHSTARPMLVPFPAKDIESAGAASRPLTAPQDVFVDYFRCPGEFAAFATGRGLTEEAGYFAFGDAVGYGRRLGAAPAPTPAYPLADA